tara:strand:- start:132 stop:317 length:186 start_codon:yes stop_codon:yes gene_type:complete
MDDRETIQEQLRRQWKAIIENDPKKDKNLTPGELIRKKAREDLQKELDENANGETKNELED